jgi:hypothetical protein
VPASSQAPLKRTLKERPRDRAGSWNEHAYKGPVSSPEVRRPAAEPFVHPVRKNATARISPIPSDA